MQTSEGMGLEEEKIKKHIFILKYATKKEYSYLCIVHCLLVLAIINWQYTKLSYTFNTTY